MQWPSRWGMGYPGWHIECSAMSRKYLGDRFDIHTGGVDHIPVHHENEIAQSEALLGHPAANIWMHAEFMMVDGGKMSKSLKNTYTIADLREKGYDPLAFRFMCLNAHYRSKLNFTWEGMESSQVAYDRFLEGVLAHKNGGETVDGSVLDSFSADFEDAITDDLNIPKALGVAWTVVRYPRKSRSVYDLLLKMDEVLGLNLDRAGEKKEEPKLDTEIEMLVEQRQQARKEKNWKVADEIREKLKGMGIILEDTPQGVRWKKMQS